ncbi:MAG: tRNA (guanosine(46)-N7)-methyltransferase TrmB [Microscillaceae bacterium]|nr:tRNA (guanosine(46)-N7)-methyltransferase TrmB [Microscillaceae bacterium]MDW8461312.1 tRNA (guanosine(46)-N7)-methyltransferase TrmB [Cytophagales bacterium]
MARKKLARFAENHRNPLVIEAGKELFNTIKGKWHSVFFKNENPITLELACGRGEYTIGLAKIYPERNYIGVDIKGARIWQGANYALKENMKNVGFLRTIIQNLENFFEPQEVSEIWITFPDPRPKGNDEKRRLTHPRFLEMYRKLLKDRGLVHLKTDNPALFEYTLEVLRTQPIENLKFTYNLYKSELQAWHHGIRTKYENIFTAQGANIHYLQFNFLPQSAQS